MYVYVYIYIYILLHHTILYCTMLHHVVLYSTTLHDIATAKKLQVRSDSCSIEAATPPGAYLPYSTPL